MSWIDEFTNKMHAKMKRDILYSLSSEGIQYAFLPPLVDKLLKMGATEEKSIKEIKRLLNKLSQK